MLVISGVYEKLASAWVLVMLVLASGTGSLPVVVGHCVPLSILHPDSSYGMLESCRTMNCPLTSSHVG
jgi:hypothetical protein